MCKFHSKIENIIPFTEVEIMIQIHLNDLPRDTKWPSQWLGCQGPPLPNVLPASPVFVSPAVSLCPAVPHSSASRPDHHPHTSSNRAPPPEVSSSSQNRSTSWRESLQYRSLEAEGTSYLTVASCPWPPTAFSPSPLFHRSSVKTFLHHHNF